MKGRILLKYDAQDCKLVYSQRLTSTIYDFRLQNAELAAVTKPGQFVQVLVPGKTLRRPISVCDVCDDTIRLVFEIRGEGTEIMSKTRLGESINIIAPLGKGFDIAPEKRTVFIGGGIGVPPMLYSARQCGSNATVINGFRNKDAMILSEDFEKAGCRLVVTTDDGSFGIHGFVTQPLAGIIGDTDMICACGPIPMLRNIAKMAEEHGVPCQVSLEQRMACGVGACLGCAVAIKDKEGKTMYKHVCKDGPVFDSREVAW